MKVPDYDVQTDQSEQDQMPSRAQMLMAAAIMRKQAMSNQNFEGSTDTEDDRSEGAKDRIRRKK